MQYVTTSIGCLFLMIVIYYICFICLTRDIMSRTATFGEKENLCKKETI